MSDLIDRQTAIDAILHITNCKSVRELFEYNQLHHLTEMWSGGVNDAIDAVIGVDSAQLGTNLAEVGTDTISRQQAIDEIDEWIKAFRENGHKESAADACLIKDGIIKLPPTQPEPNYNEWCTDCKEYDHENSCCPRWTKVIRQTRRELQDEFVMTAVDGTLWVTVDDVQKVGRVIVDEEKSKFCKTFYGDGQVEQKWIPVTERLPENGEQVLVYARSVHYALAKYDEMREANGTYKKQWVTFDAWKPFYTIKEVIAWMPLPQPYKWKE